MTSVGGPSIASAAPGKGIRDRVVSALRRGLAMLEGTSAARVARALGVGPLAGRVVFRLQSALVPETVTLLVGDLETTFLVANAWEYDLLAEYAKQPDYPILCDFLRRLRPEDVVWDVGANVGIYSCFAAAVVDTDDGGCVIAIEPHPKNVDQIEENLAANDRTGTIYPVALGETPGTATLRLNSPDVTGAFGLLADDGNGTITTRVTTGERLVTEDGVRPPSVLKVDVQGAELDALRGFGDRLNPDVCRHVYCNVYEKHVESPAEGAQVSAHLRDRGYDVTRLAEWSGGYFLRADPGSTG